MYVAERLREGPDCCYKDGSDRLNANGQLLLCDSSVGATFSLLEFVYCVL